MAKQIKIKEIAQLAGVSAGTVDRVLHNRGNVSPEKLEAVEKVLSQVGYKFNLHTSAVSLKRGYRFLFITPQVQPGNYWDAQKDGVRQAMEEYSDIHIEILSREYDQFDHTSCEACFNAALGEEVDGVIIAPTFQTETLSFCRELSRRKIPFLFVDASVEGADNAITFCTDQNACGRIAARLADWNSRTGEKIAVVHSGRKNQQRSTNSIAREQGILSYFRESGRENILLHTTLKQSSEVFAETEEFFRQHGEVRSAIVLNSRGYQVADVLRRAGRKDVCLIGFDLTALNRRCLEEGCIAALLCQRPQSQGFYAVKTLIGILLYGKTDPYQTGLIPIDLVMKENLPYYREVIF